MYESTAVEQIISKLKWYWFQIHQINSDDCLPSETTLRHLDYTNLGVLNWTDSTTQGASAYIAPCKEILILLTAEQPRCQAFSLIWITFLDPRRGFFQCDNSVIECMYVRVSVEKLSRRLVSHDQSFQPTL
jgi:hypothetical protein